MRHGPGDHRALHLTTGELAQAGAGDIVQGRVHEGLSDDRLVALVCLGERPASRPAAELNYLADGERDGLAGVLGDIGQPVDPLGGAVGGERVGVEKYFPLEEMDATDGLEEGLLPRTIRADEPDDGR